jgi:hypothetical protein
VNVEVKCDSFFNFFADIVPGQTENDANNNDKDDEGSDFHDEIQDKLADSLEQAD